MTKEERELRREQREHMKRMEARCEGGGPRTHRCAVLSCSCCCSPAWAHHAALGELSICLL